MRAERPKVQDGDTRTLSVVRQIETAPGCSSSWHVDTETIARSSQGGRPKRRK